MPRVVHQSQFQNLKLGYHQIPGLLVDHLLVYPHKVSKDQKIFQMGFHNQSGWRMKHQKQLLSLKQLHSYLQIQNADTCPRMLSKERSNRTTMRHIVKENECTIIDKECNNLQSTRCAR